jgi:membrane-associated protease RseP (regulator of RpoE activity)
MLWLIYSGSIVTISSLVAVFVGCAPSLYTTWGNQLNGVGRAYGRAEDVSMLLGTPPSRCEPVQNPSPTIGISLEPDQLFVRSVRPKGPAATAGIRSGDGITSIDGQPISNLAQLLSAIRNSREDQSLSIETTRGTRSVVPKVEKTEQCYWEVQAGHIGHSRGAAYINPWGGAASSGSSSYQRFFRASCRVIDGIVDGCQWNWQE